MLLFDGKNCNLTLQGGKDTRTGEGLRSSLASCLRQHTWNLLKEPSSNTSISLAATTRWPGKQVHFLLWGREYGQAGSKCEACPACRRRSAIFIFRQLHSTKTNLSLPLVLISAIKHQEAFRPHFRGHPGGTCCSQTGNLSMLISFLEMLLTLFAPSEKGWERQVQRK